MNICIYIYGYMAIYIYLVGLVVDGRGGERVHLLELVVRDDRDAVGCVVLRLQKESVLAFTRYWQYQYQYCMLNGKTGGSGGNHILHIAQYR